MRASSVCVLCVLCAILLVLGFSFISASLLSSLAFVFGGKRSHPCAVWGRRWWSCSLVLLKLLCTLFHVPFGDSASSRWWENIKWFFLLFYLTQIASEPTREVGKIRRNQLGCKLWVTRMASVCFGAEVSGSDEHASSKRYFFSWLWWWGWRMRTNTSLQNLHWNLVNLKATWCDFHPL